MSIENDFYEQRVVTRDKLPRNPRFIVLVFRKGSQHVPAYSRHDPPGGSYCQVDECDSYLFEDKETLDQFVKRAMYLNVRFVMFELGSRLKTNVTVSVVAPQGTQGK